MPTLEQGQPSPIPELTDHMRGLQKAVQTQGGRPVPGLINPRLFLSVEEKSQSYSSSPPGLASLEEVLAPRGLTKKDWKPADLQFSPAAR